MNPDVREALLRLHEDRTLPADRAEAAVAALLDGEADDPELAAFLALAPARDATPSLLAGAVRAVRARMIPLDVPDRLRPLLDTCGTGGDGAHTLNVSTAAALVVAACGVRVAKHGNRAATGRSGSSDVLAELAVRVDASPGVVVRCLDEVGIAYLHAPSFHPALRRLGPIRARLPFPTLFNLIGPLANPARPEAQLIGAPDAVRARLLADALDALDDPRPTRAVLLHADDGLDEASLAAATRTLWRGSAAHSQRVFEPSEFGLGRVELDALRVDGPADSARRIRAIVGRDSDPARAVVVANAALGLLAAGAALQLREGVALASEAIDSGEAARRLDSWAAVSRSSSD